MPPVKAMDGWLIAGRAAAFCAHPVRAWGRLSAGRRALLVAAYFGVSYGTVLGILLAT